MRRVYLTTFLTCIAVLALTFVLARPQGFQSAMSSITVGFLYEGDESAPYTYNFSRAAVMLEEELRDSVRILTRNNVSDDEIEERLHELVLKDCDIIFTNCHSENFARLASLYPDVQICQISDMEQPPAQRPENYHTFNGEIYQARYVSGVAAGLKLQEMIDSGVITPDQAIVGYVGAYPAASVISGYTAFLIGVRSVVPDAVMKVRYTGTWGSYRREKACASELIDRGCIVISQHSDTIGPSIACEEASEERPLIFCGSSRSYLDIAPSTALLSIRINWAPYVIQAVKAVMSHAKIESAVAGTVHGTGDVSSGFNDDSLEILDLNLNLAAKGTQKAIDSAIRKIEKDPAAAYRADLVGVNPAYPADIIDLSKGYTENADSSFPSFHYVVEDIIEILDEKK